MVGCAGSRYNPRMQHLTASEPAQDSGTASIVRPVLDRLRTELLSERTAGGHWEGQLSPSALSTATAISALSAVTIQDASVGEAARWRDRITRGMRYLIHQQNVDGGFGDTDRSHSNIATSYLVLAASALADQAAGVSLPADQLERLKSYIRESGEIDALRRRYGKDKTFVVPILTNLAIAGLVPWDWVPRLPFEAAVFPQSMYRLLRMPVVSYAIPALVAIGQARHYRGSKAWLPIRALRAACVERTMKVLRRMQPDSGGYLEATPLTSFVVMSLATTGRIDNDICRHGLRFLDDSMNEDGSWPIDTNLATWVTSLAIEALTSDPQDDGQWCTGELIDWHLACQHQQRHPFTGAEPGGWGWSDLSGAVPDSDDTPAAILALSAATRWINDDRQQERVDGAMAGGVHWLYRLQNRDGGWPTFCRGWGKLPFDRSSNDLTAHAMRALASQSATRLLRFSSTAACRRAVRFLGRHQQPDGSWLPLWFGNQDREDESNPIYGTAKVLATVTTDLLPRDAIQRGFDYLIRHQNRDGGWGGGPSMPSWLQREQSRQRNTGHDDKPEGPPKQNVAQWHVSSIEETALALDALISVALNRGGALNDEVGPGERNRSPGAGVESRLDAGKEDSKGAEIDADAGSAVTRSHREAIIRGVEFLLGCVERDCHRVPWPIGFYFAKLWYHERLYPLIFAVSALGKYDRLATEQADVGWP